MSQRPTSVEIISPIVVHDNDVLSGRGVGIAQHPGNERFRTLITTSYRDKFYCATYSNIEKKALAMEIVAHIHNLEPPGRFLKRGNSKARASKILDGSWETLSKKEALKKTTQALRDCNRTDRAEYAARVLAPLDVTDKAKILSMARLTVKQRASAVVHLLAREESTPLTNPTHENINYQRETQYYYSPLRNESIKNELPFTYPNSSFSPAGGNIHPAVSSDMVIGPDPYDNINEATSRYIQNTNNAAHRLQQNYFLPCKNTVIPRQSFVIGHTSETRVNRYSSAILHFLTNQENNVSHPVLFSDMRPNH